MARQRVEYLNMLELAMEPALEHGLPLGMLAAPLSRDAATGAISWLARVAPQWQRRESGCFQSALEILVVGGDLTVGETKLDRGAYCYWPAGSWHGPMRSAEGCKLLLMFDGPAEFSAGQSPRDGEPSPERIDALNTLTMPWQRVAGAAGRSIEEAGDNLHVKYFRTDPESGAYTLAVRQAPGWSEPKLEAHDCWEELLMLEGDYLMGTNGLVRAATYIFRPEGIPHGPQATRTGSVWLGRGNKTIDFQFSETDWAESMIDSYLSAPLDTEHLDRTPWGVWSA